MSGYLQSCLVGIVEHGVRGKIQQDIALTMQHDQVKVENDRNDWSVFKWNTEELST